MLVAEVQLYRRVFSPLPSSWNTEHIERVNTEFENEKEIRGELLAHVRKQGANLRPSREALPRRLWYKFHKKTTPGA